MNDFIFHNPDKVYFGRNQIKHLPEPFMAVPVTQWSMSCLLIMTLPTDMGLQW